MLIICSSNTTSIARTRSEHLLNNIIFIISEKLNILRGLMKDFMIMILRQALHLELRFVTCNGAKENQAHRCDPYDLRVQEQPLFLVCSSINVFYFYGT